MITKKDKAALADMLKRVGLADTLATLGNLCMDEGDRLAVVGSPDAALYQKAADDLIRISER